MTAAEPSRPPEGGRKRVIAVGRYEAQKGFDRLIDAFAQIAAAHPDWDLCIVGEGSERTRLEAQVRDARLQSRITLVSVVPDILSALTSSYVMAFPSHYEGFPNALAEGLAAGLPAVGYKGVSGVEDLIIHEQTGLLVDPERGTQGLAQALSRLFEDADLRAKLGAAARRHVEAWAPAHIFGAWKKAISEALTAKCA